MRGVTTVLCAHELWAQLKSSLFSLVLSYEYVRVCDTCSSDIVNGSCLPLTSLCRLLSDALTTYPLSSNLSFKEQKATAVGPGIQSHSKAANFSDDQSDL